MKFLLLILTLMTGSEADHDDDDVKACFQGWVQFICKYPKTNKKYEHIDVLTPSKTTLQSSQKDVWENRGRLSLYHNTKTKNLTVVVKHLQQEDFGKYECKFDRKSKSPKTHKFESRHCQQPSTQTVHRAATTTITCDYPDDQFKSKVGFLCKEESFTCEDILSTKSPLKPSMKFTHRNTITGFIVSISDVSSKDAGVYWCGLESDDGSYRVSVRQIKLELTEPPTTTTPPTSPSESQTPAATSAKSTAQTTTSPTASPLTTVIAVSVALLLLLVILDFFCKWFGHSKYRTTGEAQNQEGFVYEEIQTKAQKSDTRPAVKTVYATANFPTNPSAFTHESKVNIKNGSDEVNSNTYLTLWASDQRDTKLAANPESRVSQDSLLSPCRCSIGED